MFAIYRVSRQSRLSVVTCVYYPRCNRRGVYNLAKTDQMLSFKSLISREEFDFYSDFLDISIIDIVSFYKTDAI